MTGAFDGFSALEPNDPTTVGSYRLAARLGAGGMGRVYLSALPGGRPVALKVVHDGFAADPEFRRRFALEARAAQQVNGIHIAQLLDVGVDDPVPWLATAYIPGPSLLEAVRLHGPLPVATVRLLTAGIARALAAIHQAGLIHRDLKPANVILAEDGPRVIDFGVARAADSTTSGLTGGRVGSPQYMAPEQVRGQAATPALDVFALGALTFFAATGRPAFGEGEELAVIFRIVQEEPDLRDCPQVVRDLVAACLAKEPERRPDLASIIRYCEGEDTAAGLGWLPGNVEAMTRARKEASAALLAEAGSATATVGAGVATVPIQKKLTTGSATEVLPREQKSGGWTTGKVVGLAVGVAAVSAGAVLGVGALTKSSDHQGATGQTVTQGSTSSGALAATGGSSSSSGGSSSSSAPSSSSSSSAANAPTSTPASTPAAGANTAGPLTSGNDAIAWQGQLVFGTNGVKLDKTSIVYGAGIYNDLQVSQGDQPAGKYEFSHFGAVGKIIAWTGANAPTRQDCVDNLNSNGTYSTTVPLGGLICVKGEDYQVAVARIVAVDRDKKQATAKFVLWTDPMQQ
ncbi:MAG: serine/threonine protein kinase [Catenulispora sp.]|nr:serine/threonine protein kinase [Catenulispora sp.]